MEQETREKVFNQAGAASYLGVSTRTLEAWRWKNKGPLFVKMGRLIRYRERDLLAYLEKNARGGEGQ